LRYRIKVRCLELGLKICDLRKMIVERTGDKVDQSTFSSAMNGYLQTPKGERILRVADQILTELESEKK